MSRGKTIASRRKHYAQFANSPDRQLRLRKNQQSYNQLIHFTSPTMFCAYLTAQRFAAEARIPVKDAWNHMLALGRTISAELTQGRPVGFPGVGVLYVGPRTFGGRLTSMVGLKRAAEARGKVWTGPLYYRMPTGTVKFHIPNGTRFQFITQATKARTMGDQFARARADAMRLRAQAKRSRNTGIPPPPSLDLADNYSLNFEKTTDQETPVSKNAKPPKRGMIIEDREAAVQTDDKGRQKVAKVPSRTDEAKRQGKNESAI